MRLEGKTIVVSGAASGMGRGVASYFALKKGCRIVALDTDENGLASLEAEISEERMAGLVTDVTDEASVSASIEAGYRRFDAIHVCLSFAGIVAPLRIFDPETRVPNVATFRNVVAVNLIGTFNVMAHCAEKMSLNAPDTDGEKGVIINIASSAAFEGQAGQTGYASSKAGVVGLSLPAARELAQVGVRVNCIAPGAFDTPMLQSVPQKIVDRILETVQFPHRTGHIEEIARLCAHICENNYMNAECIRLDGGMRVPPH